MTYTKEGKRFTQPLITANGRQIFNPTAEQMAAEGWELTEEAVYTPTDEDKARQRIAALTGQLRESDYKVIKVAEATAVGAECPYTEEELAALRTEREAARAEINALQAKYKL